MIHPTRPTVGHKIELKFIQRGLEQLESINMKIKDNKKNKEKEYRISKRGIRQVRTIGTKRWFKRCSVDGCTKGALGKTDTCAAHGGGKRCSVKDVLRVL